MNFPQPLIPGKRIRRHKRFIADVELQNGEIVTAHCTNSGSMKCCIEEGADVFVSPAGDPARNTKFTCEMIRIGGRIAGNQWTEKLFES